MLIGSFPAGVLPATMLATMLANLPAVLLVNLSLVMPQLFEQTSLLWSPFLILLCSFLNDKGVPTLDRRLAPNHIRRSCIPGIQPYLDPWL